MFSVALEQYRNLRGVIVMLVVLGELEIPLELAGVRIQRQKRIAIQVIARAALSAIGRRRIPGGPERDVRCGIVGSGNPRRRPANFPGIPLPTFVTGLAGPRNGVEAPLAFAAVRVIGVDESANR